ncbi:MAG: hypothetical protein BRC26_00445 [Nanohaloarchaea archaeon QH_8_44_6]|nr:MAG: hypothetical protein BRC26_00445 [Nanohaloarchaea archaeon QH_8_44_6]
MSRLLLEDLSLVSGTGEVVEETSVVVEDDRIVDIGLGDSTGFDTVVDCEGLVAIPGMVNSHSHMELSSAEEIFFEQSSREVLLEVFPVVQSIWDGEREDLISSGYRYACYSFLRNGITTVNTLDDHPETGVDIIGESGMRAVMGFSPGDLFLNADAEEIIERERKFIEDYKGAYDGRITPSISCQGDLYSSQKLWKGVSELGEEYPELPFHTHVLEMPESNQMPQVHGFKGTVDLLESKNLLGEDSILAHFTHADKKQLEKIEETGTGLAHCPSILAYDFNGSWPKVDTADKEDISTGLGIDDHYLIESESLFQEARKAREKLEEEKNYRISYHGLFKKMTREAAEAVGLGDEVGSIEKGKKADIVLLDLEIDFEANVYRQIIENTDKENIQEVFVDGEQVVKDGEVTTMDRDEVLEEKERVKHDFREELDKKFFKTRMLLKTLRIIDYRTLKLIPYKIRSFF